MSVNSVQILGNLGSDVETKYTPAGTAVATLSIATNRVYTDKAGELQKSTEWHRVVVFGRQAENCGKYLSKGRQVFVQGRLQTRSWTDKDGQKRWTTEIVANQVQFLGSGVRGQAVEQQAEASDHLDEMEEQSAEQQLFRAEEAPF